MRTQRIGQAAGITAVVLSAALVPLVVGNPAPATATRVIDGSSFERSLKGWTRANNVTRLDRVTWGRGTNSSAARLRPPKDRSATVGITDAPALVPSTQARSRYVAHVWVKASRDALQSGPIKIRLSLGELTTKGRGPTGWRMAHLTNARWKRVVVPLTSRRDGRRLDVTVRAIDVPRGGAVLVDDVRIKRASRPSTSNRSLAGTRFGASVDEGRLDWQQALHRSDRRYTRMDVVRVFEPFIRDGWSGRLGDVNRPVAVSFASPPGEVLSGRHDATLRAWFRDAPNRTPVWWTYWHEPEDDIDAGKMTARRYRAAWRHINSIARQAGGNNLHPTLILMAWTAKPASGRTVRDYYPGDFIDVMAWDGYNPPGATGYASPKAIFGPATAKTKRFGNRFSIAELGSVLVPGDEGSRRSQWLISTARYAAKQNAAYVTYWNAKIPGENYQLFEAPSRLAWRSVVND